MLISVSSQHPAQRTPGIVAEMRLGKGRQKASEKQVSLDEHWVGSKTVPRSYSQPLGMVTSGKENSSLGQKGKVGNTGMIKQHGRKWQHLKGCSGIEITLMAPSVQPLQGAQLVCSWGFCLCQRQSSPLPAHMFFTCYHLVTAQQRAGVQNSAMALAACGQKWWESTVLSDGFTLWLCSVQSWFCWPEGTSQYLSKESPYRQHLMHRIWS